MLGFKHGQAREYLALALRVECTKDSTTNGSLVGSSNESGRVHLAYFYFSIPNLQKSSRIVILPNGTCKPFMNAILSPTEIELLDRVVSCHQELGDMSLGSVGRDELRWTKFDNCFNFLNPFKMYLLYWFHLPNDAPGPFWLLDFACWHLQPSKHCTSMCSCRM